MIGTFCLKIIGVINQNLRKAILALTGRVTTFWCVVCMCACMSGVVHAVHYVDSIVSITGKVSGFTLVSMTAFPN